MELIEPAAVILLFLYLAIGVIFLLVYKLKQAHSELAKYQASEIARFLKANQDYKAIISYHGELHEYCIQYRDESGNKTISFHSLEGYIRLTNFLKNKNINYVSYEFTSFGLYDELGRRELNMKS